MSPVANVTGEAAASVLWDAVVIGAGPAGCVTARELARSGCRVLLLEARRFPRPKVCGGCVNQHAASLLDQCGLGSLLSDSEAVPLEAIRIQLPGWTPEYALPSGWSVTRATFDTVLLSKVLAEGVSYLDEATAKVDEAVGADHRMVQVEHASGRFEVRARVVVCADGLGRGALRRVSGFDVHVGNDAFVGAGVVLARDAVPEVLERKCPAGTITMAVGRGGYVGVARAEGGQYSLGAAIRPAIIKDEKSVGKAATRMLRESGLADLPELAAQPWQGTPLLRSGPKRPSGERVFLVGDSAGYVEPFTGEGMAWALEGGLTLAPIVRAGVERWSDDLAREWDHAYRRRIRRSQWICRGFLQALHRPGLGRVVAAVFRTFPRAADRIIAAINRPVRSPEKELNE